MKKRDYPAYALERIRELATHGKVGYISRRVRWDIENLGYGPDDICDCLANLEEGDFEYCETYSDSSSWYDVYHAWATSAEGRRERPYIKLKLTKGMLFIELRSFHRDR